MADPSVILALARDNKWQELQTALQQGVPVTHANKVMLQNKLLAAMP